MVKTSILNGIHHARRKQCIPNSYMRLGKGLLPPLLQVKRNNDNASDLVTALHISALSPKLVVGTQSGQILILSTPNMLLLRKVQLPHASPNPVTFLTTDILRADQIAKSNDTRSKGTIVRRPFETLARSVSQKSLRQNQQVIQMKVCKRKKVSFGQTVVTYIRV